MGELEAITQPIPDETGTADSAGVGIAWRRYGDGPSTVLFIPTWNLVDSRILRHQVDGLRDRFRVITFDARGSGDSERPRSGYTFSHHAADALAVLDATGTPSASLVAASRGAISAVMIAARQPDRVDRLAMIAPAMRVEPLDPVDDDFLVERERYDGWEKYSAPYWRQDFPDFVRWFIGEAFSEPDSEATIDEVVRIALDADPELLIRQEAEQDWGEAAPYLASIACPTIVIHGAGDRTLELAAVMAVAAAIPGARLVLLEGLGHRPDVRRPDIVNPILAGFIAGEA